MRRPIILTTFLISGALAALGASAPHQTKTGEPEACAADRPLVAITGARSEGARGCELATTEQEWIHLWQRHRGVAETGTYNAYYNEIGLPLIDFSRCMVVAVFQGPGWNSAGFEAEIVEESGLVRLRLRERVYQSAGPDGSGQRVNAHGFFVLPRTGKELVVEEAVLRKSEEATTWSHRETFAKTVR